MAAMIFTKPSEKTEFYLRNIYSLEKACLKFAMSILRHQQDAEDAVQTAMLKAWDNIDDIRQPDSVKSWLFSIVRNCCLDIAVKNNKLLYVTLDFPEGCEPAVSDNTERQIAAKQQLYTVIKHLDKLPGQHKTVLILSCIYELTPKEVRSIMNISEKQRSVILCRARKHIKKIMDAMEKDA